MTLPALPDPPSPPELLRGLTIRPRLVGRPVPVLLGHDSILDLAWQSQGGDLAQALYRAGTSER
jgi:hypothetical protein